MMIHRFKPTIIAFLVLAILLVYANYYETDEILPPGMEKPMEIITVTADKINSITWLQNDEEVLQIKKEDKEFVISKPSSYKVAEDEVEGIRQHFAQLKAEMLVAKNATDTADFGINENSPVVRITAGKESWELILGGKVPVGGSSYLAYKGKNSVFMVPGYIRGDFYKTPDDLRNRQVFTQEFGTVNKITLNYQGKKIKLEKRDAIDWYVTEPVELVADAGQVVSLLQAAQNLRISRFVEDNPEDMAPWGFAAPPFSLQIENEQGKSWNFKTGEISGTETYYQIEGKQAIHAILNTDLQLLKKTISNLRSRYLPQIERKELQKLEFVDASGTVSLHKKDNKWYFAEQLIEDGVISAFWQAYEKARISDFISQEKKAENGLQNLQQCRSFSLKTPSENYEFYLGEIVGVNLSLLHNNEILVVKTELANAFKQTVERIRAAAADSPVVKEVSEPPADD